jgi:hypothetical protein
MKLLKNKKTVCRKPVFYKAKWKTSIGCCLLKNLSPVSNVKANKHDRVVKNITKEIISLLGGACFVCQIVNNRC